MSALKPRASSSAQKWTTRPSPYHSSVTLLEPKNVAKSPPLSPRRSKRLRLESDSASLVNAENTVLPTVDTIEETATTSSSSKSEKKRTTSPRKPKTIPQSLANPHPAPPKWREAYDAIKEIRSRVLAPVDTMGCDQAQHKESDPKVNIRT